MCNSAVLLVHVRKELNCEIKVKKFDHFHVTGERPLSLDIKPHEINQQHSRNEIIINLTHCGDLEH